VQSALKTGDWDETWEVYDLEDLSPLEMTFWWKRA
jgi:hypothetical protein